MKCAPLTALSENSTPLLARIATGMPVDMREAADQRGAVERLELVEFAAIDDAGDDFVDVVGRADIVGDDRVEFLRSIFRRARFAQRQAVRHAPGRGG